MCLPIEMFCNSLFSVLEFSQKKKKNISQILRYFFRFDLSQNWKLFWALHPRLLVKTNDNYEIIYQNLFTNGENLRQPWLFLPRKTRVQAQPRLGFRISWISSIMATSSEENWETDSRAILDCPEWSQIVIGHAIYVYSGPCNLRLTLFQTAVVPL